MLGTSLPTFIRAVKKIIEQLNEWDIKFTCGIRGFSSDTNHITTDMKQRRAATRSKIKDPRACTNNLLPPTRPYLLKG